MTYETEYSVKIANLLKEHTELGSHKAVSYLQICKINEYFSGGVGDYKNLIERNNNVAYLCHEPDSVIYSGSMHAYNYGELKKILDRNKSMLLANAWPAEPARFIERLAKVWVGDDSPVISVVREAFGNTPESVELYERYKKSQKGR
jgi:hypothetical protein